MKQENIIMYETYIQHLKKDKNSLQNEESLLLSQQHLPDPKEVGPQFPISHVKAIPEHPIH